MSKILMAVVSNFNNVVRVSTSDSSYVGTISAYTPTELILDCNGMVKDIKLKDVLSIIDIQLV